MCIVKFIQMCVKYGMGAHGISKQFSVCNSASSFIHFLLVPIWKGNNFKQVPETIMGHALQAF